MSPARVGSTSASPHGAFELERFNWGGPDRLALAGRFVGLTGLGDREPVLALHGPDGMQRLVAVPGSVAEDAGRWRAEFAWQETPTAFETAELRLGDDLVVALPEPSGRRRPFARQVFEVRTAGTSEAPTEEPEVPAMAEQVRLQADLVVAREETHAVRAELDRAQTELALTRAALDEERTRHAEDAERFRHEVLEVGASAEEAVAADRAALQRLEERLAELEAAAGEAETLRGRVGELEGAAAEAETLRARVAELEAAAEEARGEHDRLRAAVDEARTGLGALLQRLPGHDPSGAGDEAPREDG